MKKVFSILTLALLLMGFTACEDNGNDEQLYQFSTTQLNKSVNISDPNDMKVSTSTATTKWTYSTDSHISIVSEVQISDGTTAQLAITDILMQYNATDGRFEFSAPNGGTGITQVKGYFGVNSEALTLYLEFVYNNSYMVTSVAQLTYPFINATITDTENPGTPYQNNTMGMVMVVKPSDMTAQMRIAYVKYADNQSQLNQINITEGLSVIATPNGYKVTGTNLKTDVDEQTIDNFEAIVTNNGLNVSGSFIANSKYNVSFYGKMFDVVVL